MSTTEPPYYVIIIEGFPEHARDDLLSQLRQSGIHFEVIDMTQADATRPLSTTLAVWQVEPAYYLAGLIQKRLPGIDLRRIIHVFVPEHLLRTARDVFGPCERLFDPEFTAINA